MPGALRARSGKFATPRTVPTDFVPLSVPDPNPDPRSIVTSVDWAVTRVPAPSTTSTLTGGPGP